jgi:HSP20 family protein
MKGVNMTLSVRRSASQPDNWVQMRGFEDLYEEMNRLLQSAIGGHGGDGTWIPSADVIETDHAYDIEIELPGVRREDVDVQLNGNELVVKGELKERKRVGLFRRRTRRCGEFEYRVTLPGDLNEAEAEASLAYGVLKLYIPKARSTKLSKIQVTESGDGSR